ncbi:hypothetical protein FVR03_13670 [Pontibacter qinzhouensis]|uniref:Uncharacterized protein n=1 Tax=Pontibacter qinzhouensis TaxID=2603253 RepID=A0A5C8K5Z0_9BACT|nr:hypothetical protein [Pontibacter qinzhouensis]TXK44466.1 hypothetical protein FVR03_13670 [Pontibacter qinzhouensis]
MKLLVRHTFVLFLTLCILLGSVGMAFSDTLCNMASVKPAKEQAQEDSCCKKAAAGSQADDCCTEEFSFEKLEPVSSLKSFQLNIPDFFPLTAPSFAFHRFIDGSVRHIALYSADSSPLRAGRQLLHFIHILII